MAYREPVDLVILVCRRRRHKQRIDVILCLKQDRRFYRSRELIDRTAPVKADVVSVVGEQAVSDAERVSLARLVRYRPFRDGGVEPVLLILLRA